MDISKCKICMDCEEVFTGNQCPRCASRSWIWLKRITGSVIEEVKDVLLRPASV